MLISMDQSQNSLNELKSRILKLNDEIEFEVINSGKLYDKYNTLEKEKENINSLLIGSSHKFLEGLGECVFENNEPGVAFVKTSIEHGQAKILILEDEIKNLEYEIGVLTVQKDKLSRQINEYVEVYIQTKDIIKQRCKDIQQQIDAKVSGFIQNISSEQFDSVILNPELDIKLDTNLDIKN